MNCYLCKSNNCNHIISIIQEFNNNNYTYFLLFYKNYKSTIVISHPPFSYPLDNLNSSWFDVYVYLNNKVAFTISHDNISHLAPFSSLEQKINAYLLFMSKFIDLSVFQ